MYFLDAVLNRIPILIIGRQRPEEPKDSCRPYSKKLVSANYWTFPLFFFLISIFVFFLSISNVGTKISTKAIHVKLV